MFAGRVHEQDKQTVFLDIGTNGEMALGNREGFVCCATAAGPAFEGAHIKYGVGGIAGAISHIELLDEKINVKTISDKPAVGICGSGLIDAVYILKEAGAMDETGRLSDEEVKPGFADRIFEDENGETCFLLDGEICITAQDIRELQLAKAAIAAGIQTLMHHADVKNEDIGSLLVAGGFGSNINLSSACAIGLLPKELESRTNFIGNAAGTGAIEALLDLKKRKDLGEIAKMCRYIELSGDSFFQDEYINQMMFE